jgi:hypothetical protein
MASSPDLNAVRARCEAEVRALALPTKLELEQLIATIGARRERPIVLCPVRGRPVPCGMWIAADARDYIFFETDTSPLHQAHIQLHELAHLLLGHRSAQLLDLDFLRDLLPDLSSHVLQSVLERASYATVEEREAELMASLLLARLSPVAPAPVDPAVQSARDRLGHSLEFPATPA